MSEDGAPEEPPDDPSIDDDLEVLRRIPPGEFKLNGLPNSNNFGLDGQGNGTSVALSIGAQDLERVRANHEEFGVVAVRVGAWRKFGLRVSRQPLPDNPNHCEIWGTRSTAVKRALAKEARWVQYPIDYPANLRADD